jgi:hypothetical protein|tara:strand:+ start:130 stop:324 length:195 start_codon:yes stop_codon:yes gene_type:complete
MKITRIGASKGLSTDAQVLDVELQNGKRFRLEGCLDSILIGEQDGNTIIVKPCYANQIRISSED